jgi:tetratricopeptide (TPR) repeat protein
MLSNLQVGEFIYEQPAFPESDYTFKHALTQEVAYDSLLLERRRAIHERTATALEEMYPETLDDHLAELAHHYNRSGIAPKAIEYLRRAAEQAAKRAAHNDAAGYTREALRWMATLPESRERDQSELKILMMQGPLLVATQGFSSQELANNLQRAQELCRRAGETPEIFGVLFALWSFDHASGRLRESRVLAEKLLTMASRVDNDLANAGAHNAMGATQLWMGEFAAARENLEVSVNLFDRDLPRFLPMFQAPVIPARCHLSWTLHIGGFPEQAKRRMLETNDLARQLGRPFSIAFSSLYGIVLLHFQRDYADIRLRSEAIIELARENGFPYWLAAGKMCLARTMAGEGYFQGDPVALNIGLALLKESVDSLAAAGAGLIFSFSFVLLAEVYLMMKHPEDSLDALDQAAQRCEQLEHRVLEPEIHRLRGETMLLLPDRTAEAEKCFRTALSMAEKSGARSWQLRAANNLAQLLANNGKREEARKTLTPVFSQFTEGLETYDLMQAKSLLTELGA